MSLKVHFRRNRSSFCEEDQSLSSWVFLLPWSGDWWEQASILSLLQLYQEAALSLPWSRKRREVCYLRVKAGLPQWTFKLILGEECSLDSCFFTCREVSRHQISLNRGKCRLFCRSMPRRISGVSLFRIKQEMWLISWWVVMLLRDHCLGTASAACLGVVIKHQKHVGLR